MVTVATYEVKNKYGWDIRLLSTDTKPTEKVPNGSTCIEIDTGKKFLFDKENTQWHEISSAAIINARGVEF